MIFRSLVINNFVSELCKVWWSWYLAWNIAASRT